MSTEEEQFHSVGGSMTDAEKSQMFGKPCYKINKKAFVCFFHGAMVFKLTDEAHRDALSLDGAQLFDPSGKGRAMKEWVQVPFEYAEQWPGLAKAAFEYVGG